MRIVSAKSRSRCFTAGQSFVLAANGIVGAGFKPVATNQGGTCRLRETFRPKRSNLRHGFAADKGLLQRSPFGKRKKAGIVPLVP
jgi:hypothetical protein